MRRVSRAAAMALALPALALAACGDDGGDGDGTADATATFATYNAGLARGFVDLAELRAPVTIEAIAELDVDVLCVQEVWEQADVDALDAATAATLPNQIFRAPEPDDGGGEPACPPAEAEPLAECATLNCSDVPNDDLVGCVLESCPDEFGATSETCQSCLAANIGSSLDEILTACAEGGGAYAYGGSFGIGILTRGDIVDQDALVFESTFNRRAVQYARIDLPGDAPEVDVFCTHLTAVFDDIPFPGETGSWEEEQATQIEAMTEFVDSHAGASGTILLGDFNTGPAIGGVDAEVPANFELLTGAGFDAPYLDQESPNCTFCGSNPLVGGDSGVVIDHVLTRDLAGMVEDIGRILTEPLELETDTGPVTTAYSDHYGVEATIRFSGSAAE